MIFRGFPLLQNQSPHTPTFYKTSLEFRDDNVSFWSSQTNFLPGGDFVYGFVARNKEETFVNIAIVLAKLKELHLHSIGHVIHNTIVFVFEQIILIFNKTSLRKTSQRCLS